MCALELNPKCHALHREDEEGGRNAPAVLRGLTRRKLVRTRTRQNQVELTRRRTAMELGKLCCTKEEGFASFHED